MSLVSISGGATGTGTFTVLAPSTNTNRTLTLPDATGTVLDSTGGTTQTALTVTNGASIQGLTVGRGAGAVATNTAVGASALAANQAGGTNNTAIGNAALDANTTGDANTAVGDDALGANTTASRNTAVGFSSAIANTTGTRNTGVGAYSLYVATTGNYNTAIGDVALEGITTGSANTAIGIGSGGAITTGNNNTILGAYTGNQGGLDIRTASNHIVLSDGDGNPRIYIAGTNGYFFPNIRSSADANNDLRFNTGNGELYYQTSSQRYKTNIVDLEFDTSNLYNLRPVSYDDKATGNRCYGLIAEETFAQIPNVVVKRNIDGEILPDSIPYSMLSVVIINEMKKLKTLVDTQAAIITQLQADVAALKGQA